ncbi:hypothetical protein [Fischerella thermalis]|uniref:hypothetical protein n=1 Tax=Fischerella thermalis TaxID=372787 RepID=UPI00307D6D62
MLIQFHINYNTFKRNWYELLDIRHGKIISILITHYPLPITHYPLPITHYPLPIVNLTALINSIIFSN